MRKRGDYQLWLGAILRKHKASVLPLEVLPQQNVTIQVSPNFQLDIFVHCTMSVISLEQWPRTGTFNEPTAIGTLWEDG